MISIPDWNPRRSHCEGFRRTGDVERNRYLSPKERELGLKLSKSLFAMRDVFTKGERRASALEATGWRMLERVVGLTPRYLAVVNADTMQRVNSARHGDAAVGAIRVGETN